MLQSIERVLAVMGDRPADYVRRFDPRREAAGSRRSSIDGRAAPDLVALVWLLKQMIDRAGSIEGFFLEGHDPRAADVGPALDAFPDGRWRSISRRPTAVCRSAPASVTFSRASAGSACKRLNLFLRWMVRRDAHDLGVWTRVSPRT